MNKVIDLPDFILLNVGFLNLNANWNWKDVYSPFARIYFVKDGIARTKFNGNTYELKPGRLYLTPPFTLHDDECDGAFSLYYIHFYDRAVNRESIFERVDLPVELEASELEDMLVKRLLIINPYRSLGNINPKLYDNPSSFSRFVADNSREPLYTGLETQGILNQFMSRFLERGTIRAVHKDPRIEDSLQYIHENITYEISVTSLAGTACISEDHYIRLFKKEMQITPLKYIIQKKIEKAQLMLLSTDMQVRDIAAGLSMHNVSYFNRIFKQLTGQTPGEYRAQYLH